MALASVALQKAVYDLLSLDHQLTALLGSSKIFDYVPDGTAAPFVVIGDDGDTEAVNQQFTDLHLPAHELSVTAHAWTEAPRGRLYTKRILSRVHDLLIDEAPESERYRMLVIPGFTFISMDFLTAHVFGSEDSLTYHGVFRCRAIVYAS